MRVAFLDLSKTSTGWACWAPGDAVAASGTWELGSSFTSRGRVFAKLHENMMALERLGHVEAWFYEEPIHPAQLQGQTNAETIKLAAGLASHVESAAEAFGARIIRAVNQATWRREFLGKMPRATRSAELKDMAMQRCRQLGFRPLKHDQAEAIGGLTYACLSLDITPYWIAQEVLRPALVRA
jgi:hypothetical protein